MLSNKRARLLNYLRKTARLTIFIFMHIFFLYVHIRADHVHPARLIDLLVN